MFNKLFFIAVALLLFASCKKTRGCTDSEALNYNPDAAKDDRSCYYYWIGQNYGGGKVFYIDVTKKHGLIAADFYLGNGFSWGCDGMNINGAVGVDVGTGSQNTLDIFNSCGEGTAAHACGTLDTLGYSDWYLPSKNELVGLGAAFIKLGQSNLTGAYHFSSSEIDESSVWGIYGSNGALVQMSKGTVGFVKPIRSF